MSMYTQKRKTVGLPHNPMRGVVPIQLKSRQQCVTTWETPRRDVFPYSCNILQIITSQVRGVYYVFCRCPAREVDGDFSIVIGIQGQEAMNASSIRSILPMRKKL